MHALAFQGVEVGGQRGHERLAFAGDHFRDVAAVQDDAAHQSARRSAACPGSGGRPRGRRRRPRPAGRRASPRRPGACGTWPSAPSTRRRSSPGTSAPRPPMAATIGCSFLMYRAFDEPKRLVSERSTARLMPPKISPKASQICDSTSSIVPIYPLLYGGSGTVRRDWGGGGLPAVQAGNKERHDVPLFHNISLPSWIDCRTRFWRLHAAGPASGRIDNIDRRTERSDKTLASPCVSRPRQKRFSDFSSRFTLKLRGTE